MLRAPLEYCVPSVSVDSKVVDCTDSKGQPNHILIMHVFPSPQVHANQADEVYLRVGDKSKKLNFDQRLQLLYSKGARFFEDTPVPNATIDDIDLDFVATYTKKIGYGRSPLNYLRGNKDFIITRNGTEQIISAAILLFGKNPQRFFPRARVRFKGNGRRNPQGFSRPFSKLLFAILLHITVSCSYRLHFVPDRILRHFWNYWHSSTRLLNFSLMCLYLCDS